MNGATPTNLKDVFASPKEKLDSSNSAGGSGGVRSLPLLQDDATTSSSTPAAEALANKNAPRPRVPQRSASKDPSLDAVHLAERDLMEDEDMSALLQLVSNTPRSTTTGGAAAGVVFRSPNRPGNSSSNNDGTNKDNLPALQLPMIGGRQDDTGTRLERKSSKAARGHLHHHPGDADDFAPP